MKNTGRSLPTKSQLPDHVGSGAVHMQKRRCPTFLCVELECKTADVAYSVCGAFLAGDSRYACEDGGLLADLAEELCGLKDEINLADLASDWRALTVSSETS
jgi:hypothetical protein